MEATDTYRTLARPSNEILFKEKKSKFFAYAFPIISEEEVKPIIESLRKKHHTANHVCYAWQLGVSTVSYRANDDGEPNNSAGMPIYGQIQSFKLTNVLVAVARIFGGTKLGVGGLISAYRKAAQMALEESKIIEKTLNTYIELRFGYVDMNKVMRIIKQNQLKMVSQHMEMDCIITVSIPKSQAQQISANFKTIKDIIVKDKNN
ncbi:MAG: YigZ family protein [Maribacter sp.]|nr:YigZ family protein [Maribacter sp.]